MIIRSILSGNVIWRFFTNWESIERLESRDAVHSKLPVVALIIFLLEPFLDLGSNYWTRWEPNSSVNAAEVNCLIKWSKMPSSSVRSGLKHLRVLSKSKDRYIRHSFLIATSWNAPEFLTHSFFRVCTQFYAKAFYRKWRKNSHQLNNNGHVQPIALKWHYIFTKWMVTGEQSLQLVLWTPVIKNFPLTTAFHTPP